MLPLLNMAIAVRVHPEPSSAGYFTVLYQTKLSAIRLPENDHNVSGYGSTQYLLKGHLLKRGDNMG